jgi:Family of unknown function (DUF6527)
MKLSVFQPRFVDFIPRELDEGILYISEKYKTASHKCACGCGERVVTPLSPVDWSLRKDGDMVSLRPSIGNWNYACRSHYWIRKNKVFWGVQFSPREIELVQQRDRVDRAKYIERVNRRRDAGSSQEELDELARQEEAHLGMGERITALLRRLLGI